MRTVYQYRMTSPADPGKAELVTDSRGKGGYLRIEDKDGTYVGSIDGASLRALARRVLGLKHPAKVSGGGK